mmetsp:Transcript_24762/g.34128  ORF Transcript_24762/g.34128 Transcript_24762/m.34128 type:complete len:178 (+) Transcript_24762:125-658(+)|eukprot:CAMPEP_0196595564 /NCGR_PEP_ID=MMETSP1081-20130531/81356_1 /TAXON_ID=36882 /ORGANISM="Pyramimonas amylifera, Strain CCMP720" /LENGTH=177 /DNA_ID=CAMNT_0041920175 /DNA_START=102 /DNA_END=635 /DNA_ORIENTATION=+
MQSSNVNRVYTNQISCFNRDSRISARLSRPFALSTGKSLTSQARQAVVTVNSSKKNGKDKKKKNKEVGTVDRSEMITANKPSTIEDDKKHFLLTYDYVEDILEKRGPHREGHLALARKQVAEGNILMGGPLNPPTGAVFLWKCDDPKIIEEYVQQDPYVIAGLVPGHSIKEWTVLIK